MYEAPGTKGKKILNNPSLKVNRDPVVIHVLEK
jgi:hypothetical protein